MKEMENLWNGIGTAIVILALCFGIGSCHRMTRNNTVPLIQPTIEIHLK